MKKIRWELTNNSETGQSYQEYERSTYQCKDDDVWVNVEIPVINIQPDK